jgi:NAD(P)-dependent dehydrogenase (short-subunit alcohol dehydrogenase family)
MWHVTDRMVSDMVIPDALPAPVDVRNKRVVITGAGRGLGRVIATAFARSGATVGLVARSEDRLRELAESLPGKHLVFAGDVRDEEFNAHVAQSVAAECGGLDAWIANAGISPVVEPAESTNADVWQAIISTNLAGVFFGAKAAAQVLGPGGRVVVTSSVLGQRTMAGLGAYSASKAGVESLVRTMALELGPRDITVNAVAPGWFDSPLASNFLGNDALERRILGHTALGRWGQATDLPGIYLFLVSDSARFITGAVIPVDGGYLLK